MIDERINQALTAIHQDGHFPFPLNIAMMSAWLTINFKGENVKILDIGNKSSLCDYFLIATAENSIQAQSIIDTLSFSLKQFQVKTLGVEGGQESDWFLADFGDLIVHIFIRESRDTYALDQLWKDVGMVKIPDEYYFDSNIHTHQRAHEKIEISSSLSSSDNENYF